MVIIGLVIGYAFMCLKKTFELKVIKIFIDIYNNLISEKIYIKPKKILYLIQYMRKYLYSSQ